MTLAQLRIFVAVAERQHLSRAADALHLPQTAVTAAIAALETHRGAALFHRVGGGIHLSDAGSLLLREARALLARAAAVQRKACDTGRPKRSTLRVTASQTIASSFLPRHLVALRRDHPAIDIRLAIAEATQVAAAIRDSEADLGFVTECISDPHLSVEAVARDGMIVVVGGAHPWRQSADIGARDFKDAEWVLREPGAGTRAVFEAAMAALGVPAAELHVAMELPTNESVRAAVESGIGATALAASAAAPGLQTGQLHHVPFDLPDRLIYAVRLADRKVSHAAERLLEMIKGR
jgi:DNA-binding transcriptional LysR family regulator